MYEELNSFANKNDLTFSAYYDDFSFSSNKFIPKTYKREAVQIINKYGLSVNQTKSKVIKINHSEITGVIVHKDTISTPKSLFKKTHKYYLKLLDMDINTSMYTQDLFIDTCNRIQGCIAAIQSVEPERNLEHYKNKLKYIRNKYDVPVEKRKKHRHFKNIPVKK